MITNFLPGNWRVQDRRQCQENWAVSSDHEFPGAPGTTHRRYVAQIMTLEDAHLVSAAKELYEAAINLTSLVKAFAGPDDAIAQTAISEGQKALAKARGETK